MTRTRGFVLLALATAALGPVASPPALAGEDDPAAVEFFEAKVRPLLVNRCQSCHGGAKVKGGLRLDTRAEAMAGGPTGPAIVPGKPEESLLVEAINYGDDLQMPPKSKLPAEEIATLTRWVEQGAPWPAGREPRPASGQGQAVRPPRAGRALELAARQGPRPPRGQGPPPGRSTRSTASCSRSWRRRASSRRPRPTARTLIRRLTFDLIGLPPTPDEVEAFVDDPAPDAYEKLVDRLLASPHYGERWARHWLDLVRFAETSGHEFDYDIPLAYRYRDYVIRAFNADVPYDQFVVEHVAGDLLPEPRRDPATGTNESALGTGFFRFHEGVHSPVNLREDGAAKVDNQIDVLGKAFLGLTVACARCHDHKFDAITTKDYYALAGYPRQLPAHARLPRPARQARPQARRTGGDPRRRSRRAARDRPRPDRPKDADTPDVVFEDFAGPTYDGWFVNGDAFGKGPTRPGAWRVRGDRVEPLAARRRPQRGDLRPAPGRPPVEDVHAHEAVRPLPGRGQGRADQPGRRRLREDPLADLRRPRPRHQPRRRLPLDHDGRRPVGSATRPTSRSTTARRSTSPAATAFVRDGRGLHRRRRDPLLRRPAPARRPAGPRPARADRLGRAATAPRPLPRDRGRPSPSRPSARP